MLRCWPLGQSNYYAMGYAMRNKLAALVLGSALVTACGSQQDDSSDTKIVGGSKVAASDQIVKSTVALVSTSGKAFCTGSLVAPTIVVTASHCLVDYDEEKLVVAFGTVAKNGYYKNENLREAAKYFVHDEYNTTAMDEDAPSAAPNDIAMIHLKSAAPSAYSPVALLSSGDDVQVGETLTLAGFGLTRFIFGSSGVLRKVDTKVKTLFPDIKELEFGEKAYKSACMGDSGGPAFVKRNNKLVLVGVTSRGSGKCDSTGIYTDVRYFGGWIATSSARN